MMQTHRWPRWRLLSMNRLDAGARLGGRHAVQVAPVADTVSALFSFLTSRRSTPWPTKSCAGSPTWVGPRRCVMRCAQRVAPRARPRGSGSMRTTFRISPLKCVVVGSGMRRRGGRRELDGSRRAVLSPDDSIAAVSALPPVRATSTDCKPYLDRQPIFPLIPMRLCRVSTMVEHRDGDTSRNVLEGVELRSH